MDIDPPHGHGGQIGRKGFDVDLVAPLAVERVTDVGPQLGQVDVIDAAADFLVAGEADPQQAVLDLRMLLQVGGRFHDHGQARLVVGAQQRVAVGGDDRPPFERFELGVIGDADDGPRIARQGDVAAVVVANHLRTHIGAGRLGRGVEVGVEGHDRHDPAHGRGDAGQHDAHLGLHGVGQSQRQQLVAQHGPQFELARRAGIICLPLARRRIDADVPEKPFEQPFFVDHVVWQWDDILRSRGLRPGTSVGRRPHGGRLQLFGRR